MQAILAKEDKNKPELKIGEVTRPEPNSGELLVQVHATAVNRADLLQKKGLYPPPEGASSILGLELSGIIVKVGPGITQWQPGEKVFGLVPGGSYAQYAIINASLAMPIPENLSYEQAAAIPEAFLTAYQALYWLGRIQPRETLLIYAAASGVGTAAIQMAKDAAAHIIAVASASKHKTCLDLGSSYIIDYQSENITEAIMQYKRETGVDVILDFIAAPFFHTNIDLLNKDGRLVLLGLLGGGKIENFDLKQLLFKRLQILASTLRSRSTEYQARLTGEFTQHMLPKFNDGTLMPVVDRIFNWQEVQKAHEYMEFNKNTGKIVLKVE